MQNHALFWAVAAALTALLTGPSAGADRFQSKAAELIRRSPAPSAVRSYVELGRFYLAHGRPQRARQILTFALLHDPSNPLLLSEAARAELLGGNAEDALAYALEAERLAPSPERAWAVAELRRAVAGALSLSRTPAATAAAATTAPATAGPPAPPPPGELEGKVRALHFALALDAAVKGYNAGKKKSERMAKFDAGKLEKEHLLPKGLGLEKFKVKEIDKEGNIVLEDWGRASELAAAAGEYEKAMAGVSRRVRDEAFGEAVYLLREMLERFPKEPQVRSRLAHALRVLGRFDEALAVVELDAKSAGAQHPALGYDRVLLLLQSGRIDECIAAGSLLAADPKAGVYAVLARQAVAYARGGVSRELESDLAGLRSRGATAPASGPGPGR